MPQELIVKGFKSKNYKNLAPGEEFSPGNLNVLIGPNGSGKSNLIAVFQFLKNCLISSPDADRGITELHDAVFELGDTRMLDASIKAPAAIRLLYEFGFNETESVNVILELDLILKGAGAKVTINHEKLYSVYPKSGEQAFCFYKAHDDGSGTGEVSGFIGDNTNRTRIFKSISDVPTDRLTLRTIPELLEKSNLHTEDMPIYKLRRAIMEAVSSWRFYNANAMNLKAIRLSEPRIGPGDLYLSPSGENLPLVLDNLTQKHLDFDEKINYEMRKILPGTRKIRAVRPGRLSLVVEWHFTGMNECFYLNEMSDGSVRMLCWATLLLSPELPSLLVIDEPELGLHPAWMSVLAEWIKTAAERTQVMIATHSPDLLDHFTDRLEDVMCFQHDGKAHFSIKKLNESALSEKLEEGWQLGDLYRVGEPAVRCSRKFTCV